MQDLGPTTDRGNATQCGPEAIKRAGVSGPTRLPYLKPQGWGAGFILGSPREPDVQPLGKVPHLPDFPNL